MQNIPISGGMEFVLRWHCIITFTTIMQERLSYADIVKMHVPHSCSNKSADNINYPTRYKPAKKILDSKQLNLAHQISQQATSIQLTAKSFFCSVYGKQFKIPNDSKVHYTKVHKAQQKSLKHDSVNSNIRTCSGKCSANQTHDKPAAVRMDRYDCCVCKATFSTSRGLREHQRIKQSILLFSL